MTTNRLIDLTVKELSGSLSPHEKTELSALISQSATNQTVYQQTKTTWQKSAGLTLAAKPDTEASWVQFQTKRDRAPKIHLFTLALWYKVAAAVVVAIGVGLALYNPWAQVQFVTEAGETLQVVLADQTEVTLNELSALTLSPDFNGQQRQVSVTGEAYFEVARNPQKPFIIESGNAEIQVLGTAFNVDAKAGSERVEVDVTSGRVALSEGANASNKVILTKGMKGSLNALTGEIEQRESASPNFLAWQTHKLQFDDASMGEVIRDLEEYFGEEVEVANPRILNCNFTSTFADPVLAEIIQIMAYTLDLEYTTAGKTYQLSGEGCTNSTE